LTQTYRHETVNLQELSASFPDNPLLVGGRDKWPVGMGTPEADANAVVNREDINTRHLLIGFVGT
jgi:hypothetical protein